MTYSQRYYRENKARLLAADHQRYIANRPRILDYHKKRRQNRSIEQRTKDREYSRLYARLHPENHRRWVAANLIRKREISKKSQAKSRQIGKAIILQRKYASRPKNRLDHRMSTAIGLSLRGNKSGRHWETLVGYTLRELRIRLETQFRRGMTWERFYAGDIHIDHIIPKSKFSFSGPDQIDFRRCWALENLRPEWASSNLIKGSRILEPCQIALGL